MLYKVISGIEKPLNYATLVAIDFTKAFNHTVAVSKIISFGVRPSIVSTINSFLSVRTQSVKHKDQLSGLKKTKQHHLWCSTGNKVRACHFSVTVNDAAENTPDRWKFVDDLTLAEVCYAKTNSHKLKYHLDALDDWYKVNAMLPKPSKCHVMHVNFLKIPSSSHNFHLVGRLFKLLNI